MARRNKIKNRPVAEAPDQDTFSTAASTYIKQKGYSESSMEAVRRAAKANRLKSRVRIGNYPQEI